MKLLLLCAVLLASSALFSQTVRETISKRTIGNIEGKFFVTKDGEKETHFLFLSYKNKKYTHISDYASVAITNNEELKEFIADLDSCRTFIIKNTGNEISFRRERYNLHVYENGKDIFFLNPKMQYTIIYKGETEEWLEWLRQLKFP